MSNSLPSHALQNARPLCPSPAPGVTQAHVHWVGDSIQPSRPLSSPFPPALNLSQHQGFSNESALHIRWAKYWSFSFSISLSNSGLISFRIDWFDCPAVQGILKSPPAPQLESINSLAFSLLYGPTLASVDDHWKNHSFDYRDLCQQDNVYAF